MKAVYKAELRSYFTSMTGYVFIAFMMLFIGLYVIILNLSGNYPFLGISLASLGFIFMIAVPVLTMRSLAEERKNKTDQLLLTSPVPVRAIVIGKYLAMVTVFGIVCLICCLIPVLLSHYGSTVVINDYACILAFFFLGSAYLAIGLFISSLTESQVIAVLVTFGILLILTFIKDIATMIPGTNIASALGFAILAVILSLLVYSFVKNWVITGIAFVIMELIVWVLYLVKPIIFKGTIPMLLSAISLNGKFENFVYEIFDLSAILFYVSVAFIFLFLSVQSIQKRRWS